MSDHFAPLLKNVCESPDYSVPPSPANVLHGDLFTLAGARCLLSPARTTRSSSVWGGSFAWNAHCPFSPCSKYLTSLHASAEPSESADYLSVLFFLEISSFSTTEKEMQAHSVWEGYLGAQARVQSITPPCLMQDGRGWSGKGRRRLFLEKKSKQYRLYTTEEDTPANLLQGDRVLCP